MRTLHDICIDKETDKNTIHSYIDVYSDVLQSRRLSAKNVMEIGVKDGGSIIMWNEYFPSALITGIDINESTIPQTEKIRLLVGDAYTTDFVKCLSDRRYDVIIDDGPHTLDSMLFVAEFYSRLLSHDGILIIEDIQNFNWTQQIKESFPVELRDKMYVLDRRLIKNRYDDIIIILDLRK